MEALAVRIAHFFLQKHYIEPEQVEWFQYGLVRRMMGCLTFLLLLPTGAIFVGWLGSFLYLYTFRFLRTRTGGYHAKTPHGCMLVSLCTMLVALILAKSFQNLVFEVIVLFGAALCIFVLAPANNAAIHLTASEIAAIRPRIWIRLAGIVLIGCMLLHTYTPLGSCMVVAVSVVAIMLVLANSGIGAQ